MTEALERLSQSDWRLVHRPRAHGESHVPARRKFGSVGDMIVRVLADASGDLRVIEIHRAVEQHLGGAVARSSVKNYLKRGSERRMPLFEHVARGRYRLIR